MKEELKKYDDIRIAAKMDELKFVQEHADSPSYLYEVADMHLKALQIVEERVRNSEHSTFQDSHEYQYKRIAELKGRLSCYD